MDAENCSETPKQGPGYVGEPALPLPFDILLLTTNFVIHSRRTKRASLAQQSSSWLKASIYALVLT